MCLRLLLLPCTFSAPTPPPLATILDRVRSQNQTLEQRAERFRRDACELEGTLVAYHLTRRRQRADGAQLRQLNKGERERVRSLFVRRERALAESIKYERMALVLSSTIMSLNASACTHDVARALASARGAASTATRKLELLNIDELMVELEDHNEVADRYSAALAQGAEMEQLADEEIDQRLEEFIVNTDLPLERIEQVAVKLERAPTTAPPLRARLVHAL